MLSNASFTFCLDLKESLINAADMKTSLQGIIGVPGSSSFTDSGFFCELTTEASVLPLYVSVQLSGSKNKGNSSSSYKICCCLCIRFMSYLTNVSSVLKLTDTLDLD